MIIGGYPTCDKCGAEVGAHDCQQCGRPCCNDCRDAQTNMCWDCVLDRASVSDRRAWARIIIAILALAALFAWLL